MQDLGEPECYYFEEYEAPRMNPSVVAAHKRIGLLQSSTSGKGKPWKDAKVHGQDGEQDQKFGEEGFWFFKQEEEVQGPLSLGVGHSSPLQRRLSQEPHRASSFEPREGEDNTQRRRKSSKARRSSSTTGLDRVQTEETQLDRAEGRVDLEEPLFENRIRVRSTSTRTSLRPGLPTTASSKHSSTKAKEATHFEDEEEEEEEPQARSSEPNPVRVELLMAVYHLQTTT
ncbi:unnamed protein product [Microthlaspi erraticum]|uniref:Uncharacterized protein n=1 Tax=Microthlaspi erraticum TaxID=1685480 RepID=A0A6D2IAC2_9BRAS|nr:unnamed protein product [Microthlaspi erraticum]